MLTINDILSTNLVVRREGQKKTLVVTRNEESKKPVPLRDEKFSSDKEALIVMITSAALTGALGVIGGFLAGAFWPFFALGVAIVMVPAVIGGGNVFLWLRRKFKGASTVTNTHKSSFELAPDMGVLVLNAHENMIRMQQALKESNSDAHPQIENAITSGLTIYGSMMNLARAASFTDGNSHKLAMEQLGRADAQLTKLTNAVTDLADSSITGRILDLGKVVNEAQYLTDDLSRDARRHQDRQRYTIEAHQSL